MKFRGAFQSERLGEQGHTDLVAIASGVEALPSPATPLNLVRLTQQAAPPVGYHPEPDIYDPVTPAYQAASLSYQPPAAWFEGMPQASLTPLPHEVPLPESPHMAREAVSADQTYEASVMSPEMMQQLLQAVVHANASPDLVTAEPAAAESAPDLGEVAEAIFEQQMQQPIEPQAQPEPPDPYEMIQEAYEQQLGQLFDGEPGMGFGTNSGPG